MFRALFCSSWSITSSSSGSPKRSKSSSLWPWSRRPRNPRRSSKSCWCRSFLSGTVAWVWGLHTYDICLSCESQLGPWWFDDSDFFVSGIHQPTVNTSLTHSRDGSSSQGRQSYQYSKVALQLLLHATFCTSILYSLISCRLHPLPRRASLDNRKWDREYWKNMIPCLILGPQGTWQYTEHSKLGVS